MFSVLSSPPPPPPPPPPQSSFSLYREKIATSSLLTQQIACQHFSLRGPCCVLCVDTDDQNSELIGPCLLCYKRVNLSSTALHITAQLTSPERLALSTLLQVPHKSPLHLTTCKPRVPHHVEACHSSSHRSQTFLTVQELNASLQWALVNVNTERHMIFCSVMQVPELVLHCIGLNSDQLGGSNNVQHAQCTSLDPSTHQLRRHHCS